MQNPYLWDKRAIDIMYTYWGTLKLLNKTPIYTKNWHKELKICEKYADLIKEIKGDIKVKYKMYTLRIYREGLR